MSASPVTEAVWGETRGLEAAGGSLADLSRLHAVVAHAMFAAQPRGQIGRYRADPAPRVGTPEAPIYEALSATVERVRSGGWTGEALPARAVLWEITTVGTPVVDDEGDLPPSVSWITSPDAIHRGDFTRSSRTWRLYESPKVLGEAELPYISSWSGSGVARSRRPSGQHLLGWALGVAGVLIFLVAGVLAVASGRSMATAWQLMTTDQPALQASLLGSMQETCYRDHNAFPLRATFKPPEGPAPVCVAPPKPSPTGDGVTTQPKPAPHGGWKVQADALQRASACAVKDGTGLDCSLIWRAALTATESLSFGNSAAAWAQRQAMRLNGASPRAGTVSMVVQFSLLMAGIALLVIALGVGVYGIWFGAWIDQRNRVSLARAQVTLWTIVAIGGYAAMALFNVGAGQGDSDLGAFPMIPTAIAAALGIAVGSPLLSALIINRKVAGQTHHASNPDGEIGGRGGMFEVGADSGFDARPSPRDASLADIFMGEEVATRNTIDPTRLQNVVLTGLLVLGYAAMIIEALRDIGVHVFWQKKPWFEQLPDPGLTFAGLLAASHATYLVAKQFTNTGSSNTSTVGGGSTPPPS